MIRSPTISDRRRDVDESERVRQALGDELVHTRRIGTSCGIVDQVVADNIELQGGLDDFARVDGGAVDRAAEEFDVLDQPMAAVERQESENFVVGAPSLIRRNFASSPGSSSPGPLRGSAVQ